MKSINLVLVLLAPCLFGMGQEKKIYESDVLKGVSPAKAVTPTEKMYFDKRFTYISKMGEASYEGCFVVNTKWGITGATPIARGGRPTCELDIRKEQFMFMLNGMKGNEYAYFNRMEKNRQSNAPVLKHYVKTGNTHRNPMATLLESKTLYNKGVSEEFCDRKYKAWEYRTADGKNVLYLYGKEYPGDMAAYAYLGNYGLGYLKTSKGNYFILKYIYEGTRFTITSIEDLENTMVSFDPALFEVYEETAVVKSLEATDKRVQKLERDLAKQEERMHTDNSPCAVKKLELLQYQQAEEQKKKVLQQKLKDQTLAHNNQQAVASMANEYSFIESIKLDRRQTEYELCKVKSSLESGRIKPGGDSYARATRNINCWEQKVAAYKQFEEEVQAIETRNRNDAARALREKAAYYQNTVHPRIGQLRCR